MIRRMSLAAVAVAMLTLGSLGAEIKTWTGKDWPQWRGPNRDGISADTGLIKEWPENGPPLLYGFEGAGDGYCPPTIVGNRAYITGKFKEEAWMLAYELPNINTLKPADGEKIPMLGKQLWKTKFGKSCMSGEHAAPVVDGNLIFTMSGDGDVACIDTDGKLVWQISMKKEFKAHIQTNGNYGFNESPLVDGDKLIVCPGTADAVMVAYNKKTGELLWKAANPMAGNRDAASHASTMISNAGGIKHYVNLTGWGLVGVSTEGKFLWGHKKTCESSIPTPIIKDNYVFAISSYGFGSILIKLNPDGKGGLTPDVVWQKGEEEWGCLCGQAILIGDHVYFGHGKYAGVPHCIELTTGKSVWKAPRQTGSGVAALISYDGMLIFRNESKEVLLVEASPKGYNLVSKFKPASARVGYSPPVVAQGQLFLRDRDIVMSYDLRKR
jgi:outer membrane protein assembly factor BamB